MTVEISESQRWILMKALEYMTEDHGITALFAQYPDLDDDLMAYDIECLIEKLCKKEGQ